MMYATLNSYYILTTAVKLNAFLCDVNMFEHLPKASDMHVPNTINSNRIYPYGMHLQNSVKAKSNA